MDHGDRVKYHPTSKGWTWTQVAINGRVSAIAPTTYDNKANAKRAANVQAQKLYHQAAFKSNEFAVEDLDYVRD